MKKKWFLLVFAFAVVVVAVASVYLYTQMEDRGFRAVDGRPTVWTQHALPLNVIVGLTVDDDAWTVALDEGARRWNGVAGREILVVHVLPASGALPSVSGSFVTVEMSEDVGDDTGEPEVTNPHTKLFWRDDGTLIAAKILLPSSKIIDDGSMRRVAAHELGHVLGLDHDDQMESVMFWKAFSSAGVISESDAALIASTYGAAR